MLGDERPLWRRLVLSVWGLTVGASVVVGIIAAAVSKDFRHAIRDAARWLYPNGVIAVLGAVVIVLLVVAARLFKRLNRATQVAADLRATADSSAQANASLARRVAELEAPGLDERRSKDAATYTTITSVLTRTDIDYWAEHDFGAPWAAKRTYQLMTLLEEHKSVEDRFLDPELESLRHELFEATNQLMGGCALWGGRDPDTPEGFFELSDARWVTNNPPEGPRYDRFEERRRALAERADRLVATYDALVAAARARLPGVP